PAMNEPNVLVVGHCTDTTARIFCVSYSDADPAAQARLRWWTDKGGPSGTVDLATEDKPPFRTALFELQGLPAESTIHYAVRIAVPAALATDAEMQAGTAHAFRTLPNSRPLRIAFVSCNGVYGIKDARRRYVVWKRLKKQIDEGKVDLVVHGGDQIYADHLPKEYDKLHPGESPDVKNDAHVEDLTQLYRTLYAQSWNGGVVADVLASVPNIMTWDDHDIYDGYGSHKDHNDNDDLHQAYFRAARTAYLEFQKSHGPDPLEPTSTLGVVAHNGVGIVLLDSRTNRDCRVNQVLGKSQMEALKSWANTSAQGLRRLYVVSSIPVLHAHVAGVLRAVDWTGAYSGIDDDLRDSWLAPENLTECASLVKWMFTVHTTEGGPQVTVLAGDVHVATLSWLQSALPQHVKQSTVLPRIYQVTSSGIGTDPEAAWKRKLIRLAMGKRLTLGAPELTGELMQVNGSDDVMIPRRNFVTLDLEDDTETDGWDRHGNLKLTYHVENHDSSDCDSLVQVLNGPGI
ncbi:MAG TPA: alkaline phosphatase D family protein, partial [Longimicrobiaceae bacterium]|nr:alkaline phosphatase D family protein [Longimicrobiaceae bacterium]